MVLVNLIHKLLVHNRKLAPILVLSTPPLLVRAYSLPTPVPCSPVPTNWLVVSTSTRLGSANWAAGSVS